MNKKYLVVAPLLGLLLICSVLASDYSITGDREDNNVYRIERVSFDSWHNDGRDSVFNPVTNKGSKGLLPQGRGSFMYSYTMNNSYGDYRKVITLNLIEEYSYDYGNWIYSYNTATGTYWVKGSAPIRLKDVVIDYWYNKETGRVSISTPYLYTGLITTNK